MRYFATRNKIYFLTSLVSRLCSHVSLMKILFVTHYPHMMGANRSLLGLIRGLREYAVECVVLCPKKGDFTEALEAENIKYLVAPFTNWVYTKVSPNYYLFPLRILQNYIVLPRLVKQVAALNIDLIYTNSSVTAVGAYLAHRLEKKHIWHIREFVRKHYKTNYVFGRKNFVKWMNRSAAVVSISQALIDGVLADISSPKYLIYNGVMSREEMKKLNASPPPSPSRNEFGTGFQRGRFSASQKTLGERISPSGRGQGGGLAPTFTFLNVGLIHPMKQQMQALKAFHLLTEKYDNIRLIFVGKGRRIYTEKMRQFCKKNNLENKVQILGYVPNPSEIYAQSDALLMCSLHEGMGRVTAEAMAYGLPVIGLRSGATPELVQHGENGLIYEGDERNLMSQMEYLISHPNEALKMGQQGHKMALSKFTTERYVEEVWHVISAT